MKPLIIGESNPYGGDDQFALYPAPHGCSGHRLCCLILGMTRSTYLDAFDRCNLVRGKWSIKTARLRAMEIAVSNVDQIILLGSKVCQAFDTKFVPFQVGKFYDLDYAILPHPSGLCRIWNEPNAFQRARQAVAIIAPEVTDKLGVFFSGRPEGKK